MKQPELTFAGLPACGDVNLFTADAVILGIPYGSPYRVGEISPSHHAPEAIRRKSMRYPEDVWSWDFDLNDTLLADGKIKVVDCGDVPGDRDDPAGNRNRSVDAVRRIVHADAVPIIIGGDDSVPIMVFQAFEGHPINILQIDAHIDWRNEVNGVCDGYSSTMRRASEMPWVDKIIQVGARGTGTARRLEYEAALTYGAQIIPAHTLHRHGVEYVLELIPPDLPCFVTIDCDGLDPSVMPGVMSPISGGLTYYQVLNLLSGIQQKARLAGLNLVEYVPEKDTNHLGAVTGMRIIWHFIGQIAKYKQRL